MNQRSPEGQPFVHKSYVPVGGASLFVREVGQGEPIVVLHGGPDFSHDYLLPDLDQLAANFRLIYYDQRGRGQSADGVDPSEVSLESDVADLDALRNHLALESIVLLGHSWGALLALEYALRHPEQVSHLILLNSAPVSHEDLLLMRQDRLAKSGPDLQHLALIAASPEYQMCDPDAVADYYRVHFRATIRRHEHLDQVISTLRAASTREGILKARQIEDRLMDETWRRPEYTLLPGLRSLNVPVLVLHGDYDFVPVACAEHIAEACRNARLIVLPDCGHFAYIEHPLEVFAAVQDLLDGGNSGTYSGKSLPGLP